MCIVQWHLPSPLHEKVGTQCHISYVGTDTPDSWHVGLALKPAPTVRDVCFNYYLIITGALSLLRDFRLQQPLLSGLVLMVLPGNQLSLVATLIPAGCSMHYPSWRAHPSGGLNQIIIWLLSTREVYTAQLIRFYLLETSFLPRYAQARSCSHGQWVQCWSHWTWAWLNFVVATKGQC